MPYFIFRINQGPTAIVKNIDLVKECDAYKDAKNIVKTMRDEQSDDDKSELKIMFADNQLLAEEQVLESRDKPVTREWEK